MNVNSLGFNKEDNLLYAIAVGNGVDSLGNAVSKTDLVMFDAQGNSYRIGETPYRSWTGDFDDQGNLWSFDSSMDRVAVIDVDQRDADGNPVTTVYKFDKSAFTERCYDLALDASTQSFRGVCRPAYEGANATLLVVDISGATPQFSTIEITKTEIDGVTHAGSPLMTFGAAIYDADGQLYVGGNSGDHDMDNATGSSGAIFKVVIDEAAGDAKLVLLSEAPKSYSNDGAADPTAESPFGEVDLESSVLLRDLSLIATTEGALTYDDTLNGGAGEDTISGGIGEDAAFGGSDGDTLSGNDGNDYLNGGSGSNPNGIISFYDDDGNRYDQFGNLLPADDDVLYGGAGQDELFGSAGHDLLDGGADNDVLKGGSGRDFLYGGAGDDLLYGGRQADVLYGQSGQDTLRGGAGNDVLDGGESDDVLKGNTGNDAITGGLGNDRLLGNAGNDTLDGGHGLDDLLGGSGDDSLLGGLGDDTLNGGSGSDELDGGDGADRLLGSSGNDQLHGQDGNDNLNGGSGNDVLSGGAGSDYLTGWTGNDVLDGGAGRDRIYLGTGEDVATGGSDADRFVFRNGDLDGATNTITDFSVFEGDRLDLRQNDLLSGGDTTQDWLSNNASIDQNGDVTLTVETTAIQLEGLGLSDEADLFAMSDSFLF